MTGFQCRLILSISFILALVVSPATAQTVSTLVIGPSDFDDEVTLDADGNLYASYYSGTVVSKISPQGVVSPFLSGLSNPNGSVWGPDGNFYIAEAGANQIKKVTPEGVVSVHKSGVFNPSGLLFDHDGNLIISQYQASRISILDPEGNLSIFMSGQGLSGPVGMQMDEAGNLYIGNFTNGKILKRTPDGVVTELGDIPGWLGFIALVGDTIYATGFQAHRIYKVNTDGSGMSVFSGNGSPGHTDGDIADATFNGPNGITASPDGNILYISEYNTRSLRVISGLNSTSSVSDRSTPGPLVSLNNYPNPFNPVTNIHYTLAAESMVSLKVFDAHGRLVKELIETRQEAGPHEARFEGEKLPSGVYFSRLEIDGDVHTTKMMLTK